MQLRKVLCYLFIVSAIFIFYFETSNVDAKSLEFLSTSKTNIKDRYLPIRPITLSDRKQVDEYVLNSPPKPPEGYEDERKALVLPESNLPMGIVTLSVPAFEWYFGCAPTSGAMIAAYWDRNGFPNMYTGPTNGGVMPIDSSSWGTWLDGAGVSYPQCPLTASRTGLDGRVTRGSIDDYWVALNSTAPDPFITGNWTQHSYGDAIGDYMRTSQSTYGNSDGSTKTTTWTSSPAPLTCADMISNGWTNDVTFGRKLFYEAKGYNVTECYNQKTDNNGGGFSFASFQAQINAGQPVMIILTKTVGGQQEGHVVVGVGYESETNTVYIKDTWDFLTHSFTWGGSYAGYGLTSVSIVNPVTSHCGTITSDQTWYATGVVHSVTCNVIVPEGITLAIQEGAIVKFRPNTRLIVGGALLANGNETNSIYFTSYRDDSIGGDTDGGGSSSGSPGDWGWIEFAPSSDDTSTISYAVIRYGGYMNASPYTTGDLYIHDASPTIQNSTLGNSTENGAYVESSGMGASQPTFNGNAFSTNDVAGISMDPTSLLTLSGNTATGNATNGVNIRSGSITSSVTWDQTNLPYRFVGTVNVNVGSTLTIGPDMIFKGNPNQRLVISGKLLVNGSSGHSVYFTSYRDDSIGGDTNGGGSSSGSPGDWGWIEFAPSSDDTSTISYAVIRYGGYMNASPYTTGDLYIHDASPIIQDSIITYSVKHGIYVDSANPVLTCNDIFSNHDDGIFNFTPSFLVIAKDHWWGSGTGPYHPILNPTGTGNPVSDGVDFIPWLTATCHTPPNAPTSLSASAISKDQIGLTWLDNSDENEFHLERSPNGSMNWHEIGIVGANTTSFTDEPLTCSSLYYYRVRAYRSRDNQFSVYSNTAYATTLPCSALFLPLVMK